MSRTLFPTANLLQSIRTQATLLCLACLILAPLQSRGEEPPPSVVYASGWTLLLAPSGDLYSPYIADPHRPGNAIQAMAFPDGTIADAGDLRFALKAGGRFSLARLHPPGRPDRGFQLGFEGGMDGQFDLENGQDNLGWDGNYGFVLTTAREEGLGFKAGILHTSSHLGDEYLQRTGRDRIGYRRLDLSLGVNWMPAERWRLYADGGWGVDLGNQKVQAPGRLQCGLEFEHPGSLWQGRLGWYAAFDATAMEERNWRLDTSVQTGVMLHSASRTWRVGLELYKGRPSIGEFFQNTEAYASLGVWLDL